MTNVDETLTAQSISRRTVACNHERLQDPVTGRSFDYRYRYSRPFHVLADGCGYYRTEKDARERAQPIAEQRGYPVRIRDRERWRWLADCEPSVWRCTGCGSPVERTLGPTMLFCGVCPACAPDADARSIAWCQQRLTSYLRTLSPRDLAAHVAAAALAPGCVPTPKDAGWCYTALRWALGEDGALTWLREAAADVLAGLAPEKEQSR